MARGHQQIMSTVEEPPGLWLDHAINAERDKTRKLLKLYRVVMKTQSAIEQERTSVATENMLLERAVQLLRQGLYSEDDDRISPIIHNLIRQCKVLPSTRSASASAQGPAHIESPAASEILSMLPANCSMQAPRVSRTAASGEQGCSSRNLTLSPAASTQFDLAASIRASHGPRFAHVEQGRSGRNLTLSPAAGTQFDLAFDLSASTRASHGPRFSHVEADVPPCGSFFEGSC